MIITILVVIFFTPLILSALLASIMCLMTLLGMIKNKELW